MIPVTDTIIIGASAAGLACAACLQKKAVEFILLEKGDRVAGNWYDHYDRLHLHTSKKWSSLPFKKFGPEVPAYPSRRHVVDYLTAYAADLNIRPQFNQEVKSVYKEDGYWTVVTNKQTFRSTNVIIATGLNHRPVTPMWPGMETFDGTVIHSSQYKNGRKFSGKQVLVIGFGNSACEQAICLHEHGAFPAMSVRSPVNVLPRDIFGFPVLEIGRLTSMLPPKIADKINAPLVRLLVGNINKLGLTKSDIGPLEQIQKQHKIPLLDIGTIKLIRDGQIKIFGNITRIAGNTVYFAGDQQADFDAIILATGYRHYLESYLRPEDIARIDPETPAAHQPGFGQDGIYFCGFYLSPMGMLREIGIEATLIAQRIAGLSPSRRQSSMHAREL